MALTEEQLEIISEAIQPLFQYLEKEVIADIARRIKKTLMYSRTAELQAMSMRELGYSPAKIRKEAMKLLNADPEFRKAVAKNTLEYKREVRGIINDITKEAYLANDEIVANAGNMAWVNDLSVWKDAGKELTDNSFLHQLIESFAAQTDGDLKNMTQTTGFKTMSGYEAVENAYKRELDKAVIKICSGTFSRDKVVRDVVHDLAQSGLRSIDFASGYSMQLDTAARVALRTGCHQLAGKVTDKNIEQTGENLVYVSKHWGARNTGAGHANHEQWQGKVYFIKDGTDYSEEAKRIGQDRIMSLYHATGYSADGTHANDPLGLNGYNCRHNHHPWFVGVSTLPKESPEPQSREINGKTYDYYAMTQRMRSMERGIRALKRERDALKQLKMPIDDINVKISRKTRDYEEFCGKCGINPAKNRLRYESGTADLKKTQAWKDYGIIKESAETMRRARSIRTENELNDVSKSAIINMNTYQEIIDYFMKKHGIEVHGFDKKVLFDIKTTLAGYDDILNEFPLARNKIKKISYNHSIKDCGNLRTNGLSEIGSAGLRDYGTGLHEATHALDLCLSSYGQHDFADEVIETARKNLKLRKNSKEYLNLRIKMTGSIIDIDKNYELISYGVETAKAGPDNILANEIYKVIGEKYEKIYAR